MTENQIKDDVKNKAIDFINDYISNNHNGDDNKIRTSLGILHHSDNVKVLKSNKELQKSNEDYAKVMKYLTFALVLVGVISIGVQIWATYYNSHISSPRIDIIK